MRLVLQSWENCILDPADATRRPPRCSGKMSCWGDAYKNLMPARKAQRGNRFLPGMAERSRQDQVFSILRLRSLPLVLPTWRGPQGAHKEEVQFAGDHKGSLSWALGWVWSWENMNFIIDTQCSHCKVPRALEAKLVWYPRSIGSGLCTLKEASNCYGIFVKGESLNGHYATLREAGTWLDSSSNVACYGHHFSAMSKYSM